MYNNLVQIKYHKGAGTKMYKCLVGQLLIYAKMLPGPYTVRAILCNILYI